MSAPDDTIRSITLDQDEGASFLRIECDDTDLTLWLNDVEAMRGLIQAGDRLRDYVREHDRARATWLARHTDDRADDRDAYPGLDPKNPDYLDLATALADQQFGGAA